MAEREKVIRGLECCITGDPDGSRECKKCPYRRNGITNEPCFNALHADALALLKEQKARVMTLEELDDYRKTEEGADPYITLEKTPVMVEYSNDVPYNTRWLTIESLNLWLDYRDMRVIYGKEWRAWTSRPTEEQRKAVPWDAEP